MAKSLSLIILAIVVALPSSAYSKQIRYRYYLQDKFTPPNRTVYQVAAADITSVTPSSFGLLCVVYDPLTADPEHDSELVGYAQGTIAFADLKMMAVHASITVIFTAGEYNGSSFNIVGRNSVSEEIRKIPIVGGTGAFEMAFGIATTRTHAADPGMNWATYQYDIAINVPSDNVLEMYE